jgi:hypothetical protein
MNFSELIKRDGASGTTKALEQRARRMAKRKGMSVTKLSLRSRWVNTYGPYMVSTNYNNTVIAYGIQTVEEVIDYLAEKAARWAQN